MLAAGAIGRATPAGAFVAALLLDVVGCSGSLPVRSEADGGCAQGTVTLHMQAAPGAGDHYDTASFGDPGDGVWWYSVAKADGTPLRIFLSQATTCGACRNAAIPLGRLEGELTDTGVRATWDGVALTGTATCSSSGTTMPCDTSICVPAGQYVVTMCADRDPNASGADAGTTCVSVPFEYPSNTEIVGTLPL
jgi:hypothetical protein